MFRKVALLVALFLTLGSTTVSAQDSSAPVADLDGLESAYTRIYAPDFNAEGTPGAESMERVTVLTITGYTFDGEDAAAGALEPLADEVVNAIPVSHDITGEPVDDLGDSAVRHGGEFEDEGGPVTVEMVTVQDGDRIYQVSLAGAGLEDGDAQVDGIVQFMLDGEIESDEVAFSNDGTSTGGVFDLMPTDEDRDITADLTPQMDGDLMDVPAAPSS